MLGDAMPQGWRGRHAVEAPKTLVSQFLTGACANGNDFPDFLVKSENRAGLVFWRQPPGTRAFQRNTQDTLCRSTLNTILFCVVIKRGIAV